VDVFRIPKQTPRNHAAASVSLRTVTAYGCIGDCGTVIRAEEFGDLILDAGDDLAVEEGDHSGDQERAEDNSDDNLDAFRDVEVTVFVVESVLCRFLERLSLEGYTVSDVGDRVFHNRKSFRF